MTERSVVYRFEGRFDNLKAGLTSAGQATGDLGRKLTAVDSEGAKARASLTTLGATAGKVGLVAAGGLGAAVKAASDFEGSFARMEGLVGVAREQLDEWRGQVMELGPAYGATATSAADALFFITSAGLEGTDAMEALEASLKASAVGLGDVNVIADLATSAMNAYGSDTLSAAQATDVLTAAVREGKLEPDQLAGAMGRVLPIASAMGVSFDEVGAAMAAMSRTGTNAAEAATQIRGILTSILSPSQQAHKGFEAVGLSAQGLQASLASDGLYATLVQVMDAFDGNAAATEAVFGNVRALSGVMDLMGSNAEATEAIFNSLSDSTGSLDDAFDVMSETAGFKTKQAIAELQGALIEIGDGVLPMVSAGVSNLASVIGSIPGPVKSVTGPVLGLTAALGGGVWATSKAVNTYADLKKSLQDLSISAPRAGSAMRGLGKAAVVGLALEGVGRAINAIDDAATAAAPSVDDVTASLLNLNRTKAAEDFAGVADAIGRLEAGGLTGLADDINRTTAGLGGWATALTRAPAMLFTFSDSLGATKRELAESEALIANIDTAFAQLVSTVGVSETDSMFRDFAASVGLSASETSALRSQLDGYRAAVQGAGNEASIAARGTLEFADASDASSEANSGEEQAIRDVIDAMREKRAEAVRAFDAETNWYAAIDDATQALEDNGKTLSKTTEEGRANRSALSGLAAAWNNLSDRQKNANGAAKSARDEFVKVATQMGMNEDKARRLARRLMEIPEKRVTKIEADTKEAVTKSTEVETILTQLDRKTAKPGVDVDAGRALGQISMIQGAIDRIRGRTITIGTRLVGGAGGAGADRPAADGHSVPSGGPYVDQYPYLLAPGEEVISNRYGQADRHRPLLKAINAGRLADGGTAGLEGLAKGGTARRFAVLTLAGNPLRDFERQLEASTDALKREESARDKVISMHDALASSVRDRFNSDLWTRGNAWSSSGANDPWSVLREDIAGLTKFNELRQTLEDKGLKGSALDSLLANADMFGIEQMASASTADLKSFAALFAQREALAVQVGQGAAGAAYGDELAKSNALVREQAAAVRAQSKDLNQMRRAIERQEKTIAKLEKNGPERTGRAAAEGVTKGAVQSVRNRGGR